MAGNTITGGVTYLSDDSHALTLSADRTSTLAQTEYGINQMAFYVQDRVTSPATW